MEKIVDDALTRAKFILKLAGATNMSDDEANNAILAQLRESETKPYFPALYTNLVPMNYGSHTKLASDLVKRRLTEATRLYSASKK